MRERWHQFIHRFEAAGLNEAAKKLREFTPEIAEDLATLDAAKKPRRSKETLKTFDELKQWYDSYWQNPQAEQNQDLPTFNPALAYQFNTALSDLPPDFDLTGYTFYSDRKTKHLSLANFKVLIDSIPGGQRREISRAFNRAIRARFNTPFAIGNAEIPWLSNIDTLDIEKAFFLKYSFKAHERTEPRQ
jgi:hypothetical protein